jgi:catechol 2,3-dioxygenase-like lactoylglutathione lyase family enzyme
MLLGLPGAHLRERVMRLGGDEIALVQIHPPGAPYPAGSRSDDLWFQHLAIVADDMGAAYRRVARQQMPAAISTGGPQVLPPRNGGVSAFKFRDPDGHPLELIHFPRGEGRELWQRSGPGPFLGIDHSALAVSATKHSLRFYRRLGFRVAARSFNHGPAQARLDGLPGARVQVTGLRPASADGPGLELLGYRPPGRPAPHHPANARVTDWVTLLIPGLRGGTRLANDARAVIRRDPDGHMLLLVDRVP